MTSLLHRQKKKRADLLFEVLPIAKSCHSAVLWLLSPSPPPTLSLSVSKLKISWHEAGSGKNRERREGNGEHLIREGADKIQNEGGRGWILMGPAYGPKAGEGSSLN